MMVKITVPIVQAFVDNGRGGNAAGVVLDAERFTQEQKQRIASRVGLSETAFVSPSRSAAVKLEFFTPTRQVPHCGHATVATFSYLVQTGRISGSRSSKETIDGNREILLKDGMAFLQQLAPAYTALPQKTFGTGAVLSSLGLAKSDLQAGRKPMIVTTGLAFLIVPVNSASVLARIRPDFTLMEKVSDSLDIVGFYAFATQASQPVRDASTRMFAPRFGIREESATGMAAGPLSCYLHDHAGITKERIVMEQGHFMDPPSPSELIAELTIKDGKIQGLIVGGRGVVSRTMEIEIDD